MIETKKHTLKNGTHVYVSALTKEGASKSRALILDGFKHLSAYTIRQRFLGQKRGFTDSELSYLTEVDNFNHVAIGVTSTYQEQETGVGIARFVRSKEDYHSAEFAVLVIDPFQGLGLGKIIFERLVQEAKRCEIKKLTGTMERDNIRLTQLLEKFTSITIKAKYQELVEVECLIK